MLQNVSFRWKLYIIYGSITAGILVILMSVFFVFSLQTLNKNMEDAALTELELMVERLEDFLVDKDQQLQFFHTLPEFEADVRRLAEAGDPQSYYLSQPEEAEAIQKIFLATLTTEKDGNSVAYISNQANNVYASVLGGYDRTLGNVTMEQKVDVASRISGEANCYYIYPHEDYWRSGDTVLSVFRPVHDMFRTYGLLVYNVEVEALEELLLTGQDDIYLLDLEEDHCYSIREGIYEEGMNFRSEMEGKEDRGYLKKEGHFRYYYIPSKLTGWTLVTKRDISGYLRDRNHLIGVVLLMLLTGSAAILGMLYVVSKRTAAPLLRLKEKLETYVEPEQRNEITALGTSIERLVNEMMLQNQKLAASRELAYQAQLSAMEAQLNPHFLYNTLSVIGTYGLEQDNMAIPQMCSELSGILRYSISCSGQAVTLEDELQNIRSYLYIMEMRYEDMISCTWELDPAVSSARTPKLILQPVVENCFKHGFQMQKPVWKIRIRSWQENGEWRVSVSNSGMAFDREKIDRYQRKIEESDAAEGQEKRMDGAGRKTGVGLRNTILRMRMFYHGREHFEIILRDGFTTVVLGGVMDADD